MNISSSHLNPTAGLRRSRPQSAAFAPETAGTPQALDLFQASTSPDIGPSTASARKLFSPQDSKFQAKYGPWAVVTGASGGIGAEYAEVLAEKGLDLVVVARGKEKLEEVSRRLQEQHGVKVRVVPADLASPEGIETIKKATADLEVGLLVNNAGIWQMGDFLQNDIEKDLQSVKINAEAPMQLTHHFAGKMAERGRGGVINVGSGAALHGVPGQAAYSAAKGFLLNFTESMRHELKAKGVDVIITNPGPVRGEASSIYDQSKIPLPMVSGREVALDSIKKLGKKTSTVTGWLNQQAMSVALRVMPRDMLASIAGYMLEKASQPSSAQALLPTAGPRPKEGSFKDKYGPWAVVTGASGGLGSEYARELAKRGMNIIAVARSKDKLDQLKDELVKEFSVEVKAVDADLTTAQGRQALTRQTAHLDVGLLVNNAGTWQFGDFLQNDISKDSQVVSLNAATPMYLSHQFGRRMAERGGGGIINVGSGAALHGVPGQATYSATKGFLRNLTEGLNKEFKKYGVDVLVTNPGPINGEASSVYDQSKVPLQKLDAAVVAAQSLDRLGKGAQTIPGRLNRTAMAVATTLLSRDHLSALAGHFVKQASETAPADKTEAMTEVAKPNGLLQTAALKAKGLLSAVGAAASAGAGALWGAAVGLTTNLIEATKMGRSFMGDMETRAREISADHVKVEQHLTTQGMHHEYRPPVNKSTVKMEGKLTIKASMAEFFELWESWIAQGYGSINDRQYADVVLKYKDWAKEIPMLKYVPMTSVDTFTADIREGKMQTMTEVTKTSVAGLIPTSRVDWAYRRTQEPQSSNSFEHAVDKFNGDIAKVQDFYQNLFDPKRVNPNSKATVVFECREVSVLPELSPSSNEFEHKVNLTFPFLAKKPASTLG